MYRVFKYELDINCIDQWQTVVIPEPYRVLSAGFQEGQLVVWAEVEDSSTVEDAALFYVAFTGSAVPASVVTRKTRYLTTLQHQGFVFHIYYK